MFTINRSKKANTMQRSEMQRQCRLWPLAIRVAFPVTASNEVTGAWKAHDATAITHNGRTGVVIIVSMGEQDVGDRVRLHADRSQSGDKSF